MHNTLSWKVCKSMMSVTFAGINQGFGGQDGAKF